MDRCRVGIECGRRDRTGVANSPIDGDCAAPRQTDLNCSGGNRRRKVRRAHLVENAIARDRAVVDQAVGEIARGRQSQLYVYTAV